jgi:hypothetical protein
VTLARLTHTPSMPGPAFASRAVWRHYLQVCLFCVLHHPACHRQEIPRPFNTSNTFGFTTLMGLPAA